MKNGRFFIAIACILSSISQAVAQEHFCQTRTSKTESFSVLENTLALDNEGGLFGLNTGVCWWNSWFLLRANYLMKFAPECPGPDIKTKNGRKFYRKLYLKLLTQNEVLILPGYKNLRELTSDPYQKDVLQKALQSKMAQDSFIRLKFIEAFEGRGHWGERDIAVSKKNKWIARQINELKNISAFIQKTGPAYVMLQNPGISTHALIIFKVEQNHDEFVIYAQDSNYQSRLVQVPHAPYRILHYRNGQWFDDKYGQKLSFHIYLKREMQVMKTIESYEEYCLNESLNNYCPTW
jgi:hypothetical protein